MAENIIINNTTPSSNNQNSNQFSGLIRALIILIIVASIVALIFGIVVFVENYDLIATVLTTGFIGYLNPFDSPDGDTGPIDSITGVKGSGNVLSYFVPAPLRWIFRI
jgi:hypothetical protein